MVHILFNKGSNSIEHQASVSKYFKYWNFIISNDAKNGNLIATRFSLCINETMLHLKKILFYTEVHSSSTHNSQKVETTRMSIKKERGIESNGPSYSLGYSDVHLCHLKSQQTTWDHGQPPTSECTEDDRAGRWNEQQCLSWAAKLTSTGVTLSSDSLLSEIVSVCLSQWVGVSVFLKE